MRYKRWFFAFLAAYIVIAAAILVTSSRASSPPALARAVVAISLLAFLHKLVHACLTRVHVANGSLVYRDHLLRRRHLPVSHVRKLTYVTNERLAVESDDGSRLVFDPRLMTDVPSFIETLSFEVTRHRPLLFGGDLE